MMGEPCQRVREREEFVIRIHDVTGDDIVAGKEAMFLCDVHTEGGGVIKHPNFADKQ